MLLIASLLLPSWHLAAPLRAALASPPAARVYSSPCMQRRGGRGSGYVRGDDSGVAIDERLVENLLAERQELRFERRFQEADAVRDKLSNMGITLWDRDGVWVHGAAAPPPMNGDDDFGGRGGGGGFREQRGGGGGGRGGGYVRRRGDTEPVDVAAVEALIEERTRLRREHDFAAADRVRDRLTEEFGVTVYDRDNEWFVGGGFSRGGSGRDGNERPGGPPRSDFGRRDSRDRGRGRGAGGDEPEFRRDFAGTRCFVENLSFETDWQLLKDAFLDEGYPVVYCSVSTDRFSGESKGHGIVQFETVHAAKHAIEQMTGFILDGRTINVREDYQEKKRRVASAANDENLAEEAAVRGGGGAARREAWQSRTWTRVSGTGDKGPSGRDVDEKAVLAQLVERDAARERKDFATADLILDELAQQKVYLDDARRQRKWWVGQRADGGGDSKSSRGASAAPNRRSWYNKGGEDADDDGW